jgi:hypothetical protein
MMHVANCRHNCTHVAENAEKATPKNESAVECVNRTDTSLIKRKVVNGVASLFQHE